MTQRHPHVVGLAEYTSRQCRFNLVRACIRGIENSHDSDDNPMSLPPTQELADHLKVTQRTVQRWVSGGVQSCNVNADRLISLAFELNPKDTLKILDEDYRRHQEELDLMVNDYNERQGVVVPAQKQAAVVA